MVSAMFNEANFGGESPLAALADTGSLLGMAAGQNHAFATMGPSDFGLFRDPFEAIGFQTKGLASALDSPLANKSTSTSMAELLSAGLGGAKNFAGLGRQSEGFALGTGMMDIQGFHGNLYSKEQSDLNTLDNSGYFWVPWPYDRQWHCWYGPC